MPRRVVDDDEWNDDEGYDGDEDAEEDEPTVACPCCERRIPEDTPRCPYCENYISDEDAPPTKKPWWIAAGVVICLYIVYRWTVM